MNPPSQKQIRTVALASLLGATIEWYDFFLYGVVAGIVFNKLYFPTDDPFIGTLLAYSTFAIGYLARPFGAFVFGHFGDKIGRKSMLVLTMLIMGIATIGIGLVPTYAQIGIAAPAPEELSPAAKRFLAFARQTLRTDPEAAELGKEQA